MRSIHSISHGTLDNNIAGLGRRSYCGGLKVKRVARTRGMALPMERAWRVRTAPGTIRGVHTWRSSLCKECSTMSHTTTLRTLIQAPDLLVMPGVFDGFSARLVEQSGFAAGFISGAGLSETLLGWSDVGLMGFELNLAAVTRLAACSTLPLLADADTGYGNAVT